MICEICGKRRVEHRHHKFSQEKRYKKAYKEFIHHKDNIIWACSVCHLNKSMPKWDEIQFCKHFGITPRTKAGLMEWERYKNEF